MKTVLRYCLLSGLIILLQADIIAGDNNKQHVNQNKDHGLITDIDGNRYKTVVIGSQVWMAEDLRTTRYNDGTPISYPGNDNVAWSLNQTGSYAWYDNDPEIKHSYGALYNWYAVSSNRLCLTGWRVPSDKDWTVLTEYIASLGNEDIGNMLKSCLQKDSPLKGDCDTHEHPRWRQNSIHWGTDDFGFAGLPSGVRSSAGDYHAIGRYVIYWTSTQSSDNNGWSRGLDYKFGNVSRTQHYSKSFGFSVRCVRDLEYFKN